MFRYFLIAFLSLTLWACGSDEGAEIVPSGTAYWNNSSSVAAQKGNAAIRMEGTAGTQWQAEITEGSEWCSFSLSSKIATKDGTLVEGMNVLYVYYSDNINDAQRQATVTVCFAGGKQTVLTLSQKGQVNSPEFSTSWAEIPAYKEGTNFQYVTHYVNLNGKEVRNYSMCYDKSHKGALWVAYPLHSCYIGGLDRTDEWIYDPDIAEEYQIFVARAYKEYPAYDRGHQIPSADRTMTREMNAQTFYFSNQTPQTGKGLNQSIWMNLEDKLRKSYMCSDTLYVVTGAYYGNASKQATDNNGVKVDVPTHYFKVLLRTKSGVSGKWVNQCDASQLQTIGFWLENKAYSESQPSKAICKKVSEIEQLTGFTFFPGIPQEVKNDFNAIEWNLN